MVARHGEEYPDLTQHHHDEYAGNSGHRPDRHNRRSPFETDHTQRFCHWRMDVDLCSGNQAGQDSGYGDVEHGADAE